MPAHLDRTLDEGRHRGRWKGRRDSFRKRTGAQICACEIDAEMGSNLDFLFSVHFFRC